MSSVHVFWITSRAAGIVALLASSLAVSLGLMMSLRSKLPDLRATHEALSLATIAAIVVHSVALLGDSFMKPSLARHRDRVRERRPAVVDDDRDRRRVDADPARPLLLRARAHRAGTLAQPASLHPARRRRGHRRQRRVVPRRGGMVVLPAGALLAARHAPAT